MDSKKVIVVSLAGVVAAPYLAAALTDPSGPLPEAPKVALQAIISTSSSVVLDTVMGREISMAPAVEHHRPVFIPPEAMLRIRKG
jgi:hypothetical protein